VIVDSFDDLYLAEQRRAYQLAYLLCGNVAMAEDAVAGAFVSVWPRWDEGGITDLGPYLRRAVVNQVITGSRRRALERRERARRPAPTAPRGPEDLAVDREVLKQALLNLPPRQRTAIVLRYFDDLTVADIAGCMATSIGTTKAHLSRGLAALRARLCDEGGQW
jgi:RNA polymerase sigma-70 factor (sigma-E family)